MPWTILYTSVMSILYHLQKKLSRLIRALNLALLELQDYTYMGLVVLLDVYHLTGKGSKSLRHSLGIATMFEAWYNQMFSIKFQ